MGHFEIWFQDETYYVSGILDAYLRLKIKYMNSPHMTLQEAICELRKELKRNKHSKFNDGQFDVLKSAEKYLKSR